MRSLLAMVAAFLTACSTTAGVTTTGPVEAPPSSTTTVEGTVPSPGAGRSDATRAEIEAALEEVGPVGSLEDVRAVIGAVDEGSEPDLVPYLYDVARVADLETFSAAMEVIARIIGETAPADDFRTQSLFYGNWIMDYGPEPGPAYVAWKAALFGNIDPSFEPLIASVDDPVVASRLQWGGVRRGGIPELNDAETLPATDAGYMTDGEIVFGAVVNGASRAYPVRILGHHELANDTLGGEPVALAYCTLCRTPVLYSRRLDERVLDFETSGLLQNSNKVMVDVQTDSLWNQLTGEAFAGPLAGKVLEMLPMTVTTWADWVATHPDTDVVGIPAPEPGALFAPGYSYEPGDAYADYYAGSELWFPTFAVPDVFAEKDEVVTLDFRGDRLAAGLDALLAEGGLVATVAGVPVVFVASGNGARVFEGSDGLAVVDGAVRFEGADVVVGEDSLILPDGTELPRLVSGQSFWFAWYGNFPDTAWWPAA